MSLRPRYSLLTLLVLTALVAGGVKLWRGPHHVVKEMHGHQDEYTFTRDFFGNQKIHGPRIERLFGSDTKLYTIKITYFRDGHDLRMGYFLIPEQYTDSLDIVDLKESLSENPLSELEQVEFATAIKRERDFFHKNDSTLELLEGYWRGK